MVVRDGSVGSVGSVQQPEFVGFVEYVAVADGSFISPAEGGDA